jgi:hypothetical protein
MEAVVTQADSFGPEVTAMTMPAVMNAVTIASIR